MNNFAFRDRIARPQVVYPDQLARQGRLEALIFYV